MNRSARRTLKTISEDDFRDVESQELIDAAIATSVALQCGCPAEVLTQSTMPRHTRQSVGAIRRSTR